MNNRPLCGTPPQTPPPRPPPPLALIPYQQSLQWPPVLTSVALINNGIVLKKGWGRVESRRGGGGVGTKPWWLALGGGGRRCKVQSAAPHPMKAGPELTTHRLPVQLHIRRGGRGGGGSRGGGYPPSSYGVWPFYLPPAPPQPFATCCSCHINRRRSPASPAAPRARDTPPA